MKHLVMLIKRQIGTDNIDGLREIAEWSLELAQLATQNVKDAIDE